MAAILSGLDAVVFCGGIGENAWRIRDRVCRGLRMDGRSNSTRSANQAGEMIISSERSRVRVFIIPTNEEMMIARHTARLLGGVQHEAAKQPLASTETEQRHGPASR